MMTTDYYITTWEMREDTHRPWVPKAAMVNTVNEVLTHVKNLEMGVKNSRVGDIAIRKFNPRNGVMTVMEPFLDGWEVGLREVILAPKDQFDQ